MLEDSRHGPLPALLLALTAISGTVDAVSYLRLGHVFVANMTGNIVFVGFAAAGAPGVSVASALLAIAAFVAGAIAGGRFGVGFHGNRGQLLAISCAFTALLVLAAIAVAGPGTAEPQETRRLIVIALLALTMGTQTAVARRIGVPDLTTTVVTLTLTSLASESRLAGGHGMRAPQRIAGLVAMAVGAFIGAVCVLNAGIAVALGVVAATFAGVALIAYRVSRNSPAWSAPASG